MNGHMDANIARFATHSPAILLAGMGVAAVVILLGAIMIGVNWSPHLGRASTKHPRSWDSFAEAETKRRKSCAAGQAEIGRASCRERGEGAGGCIREDKKKRGDGGM